MIEMGILVIHLERAGERKQLIEAELTRMGWQAEFVAAIDGATGDFTHVDYCYRTAIKLFGRGLSAREAACCLSHARAWEMVAASAAPALIIEDDCQFTQAPDWIQQRWQDLPADFDLAHFQRNDGCPVLLGDVEGGFQRCLKLPLGTCATAISPDGARELLQRAFPIAEPVDVLLSRVAAELQACILSRGESFAVPAPVASLINVMRYVCQGN